MYGRPPRSPYLPAEEEEDVYTSPYGRVEEPDEQQSPIMQAAVAEMTGKAESPENWHQWDKKTQARRAADTEPAEPSKYGSAYGTSYQTAPNVSWMDSAKEAAGSASFSTEPQGADPPTEDVTKADLEPAKTAVSDTRKRIAEKQAELDAINKEINKAGPWDLMVGKGVVRTKQIQAEGIRRDLHDLNYMALAEEDRKNIASNARAQTRANAQIEAAKIRAGSSAAHQSAIEKTGKVDNSGTLWYVDPETKQWRQPTAPVGTPAQGNVLDADNPTAASKYSPATPGKAPIFAKPKSDKPPVTGVSGGYVETDEEGKTVFHRTADPRKEASDVEKDKTESAAQTAGRSAAASFRAQGGIAIKGGAASEAEAFKSAYITAGGSQFKILHPRGETTTMRNKKTGDLEEMRSDGTKFVPTGKIVQKANAGAFARSHG